MAFQVLLTHRAALYNYTVVEKMEAGLVLMSSEVKSLRLRQGSIKESFVVHRNGELFLHNAHISDYKMAVQHHAWRRERKLLLHKRQIHKLIAGITRKGQTAIPLQVYNSQKGLIKIEIALAVGKKAEDKRAHIQKKEWERSQHRILKQGAEA